MSYQDQVIELLRARGAMSQPELSRELCGPGAYSSRLDYAMKKLLRTGRIMKIGCSPAKYTLSNDAERLPDSPVAQMPAAVVIPPSSFPESIATKIDRFYSSIENYQEGGPETRFKSWEWCHEAFLAKKGDYQSECDAVKKEEIVEFLALHLAFYLASWGMYRGSTYLLKRDYKAHKSAVKIILEERYDTLWNYEPTEENVGSARDLLFSVRGGLYERIKGSYKGYEGNDDNASDTLTTKILLGTFGCVPAFDTYLKNGISAYKKHCPIVGLTRTIDNNDGRTFVALAKFAIVHREELRIHSDFFYPPMKCVDMFFWEIGYELSLAAGLTSAKKDNEKKKDLLKDAIALGICSEGTSFEQAIEEIEKRN